MALVVDDILDCAASAAPNRLAVTLGDQRTTFGELRQQANRLANALLGTGVAHGDRVAWWSETSLDGVGLYFGPRPYRCTVLPDEPRLRGRRGAGRARVPAAPSAGGRPRPRRAGRAARRRPRHRDGHHGRARPGCDLDALAAGAAMDAPPVEPPEEDDVFSIFLTSGSTGRPKGVMVSQRATWLRTHAGAAAHATTGGHGDVVMFPLFHMAGWNFSAMAWSAQRPAHLVHRADPDLLLAEIERWSAATLYCLPAVWQRVLACDRRADTSSLEWALTGTSEVTTELLSAIKARFPTSRTTVNYGATETDRAVSFPTATSSTVRAAWACPSPASGLGG